MHNEGDKFKWLVWRRDSLMNRNPANVDQHEQKVRGGY